MLEKLTKNGQKPKMLVLIDISSHFEHVETVLKILKNHQFWLNC